MIIAMDNDLILDGLERAIYRVLESFHKRHPVEITFRDLRKSFGTNLAMQGCPPNVLKELMGHSDIAMTLGYYVDVDMERMAEWSIKHTISCQRVSDHEIAQ